MLFTMKNVVFWSGVQHTDAEREFACVDCESAVGRLDEAGQKCWIVVDMKKDWKRVFPFQK